MAIKGLVAAMAALGVLAGMPSVATAQPQPADGLRIVFCGTSGPLPVRDRAKPCTAVMAGGALYLVDVGPEATENLLAWRLPLASAKAVFLTHLHSDHIGEVGEFNMQSWVAGRPAPLALVGPAGVDRVAAGFNLAYAADHAFRRAHHERDGVPFPLAAGELKAQTVRPGRGGQPAVVWNRDGLTVTAIRVDHDPVTPAYAYRFDYRGRSVVVSGDTRKTAALAAGAKGADVLIHEAQHAEMMRAFSAALGGLGQPRMSSVISDTLTYHTTPVEAAETAREAGVRSLVLSHITQAGLPMYSAPAFTRGMPPTSELDWRIAGDGMTIDLPAGGAEIRYGRLP